MIYLKTLLLILSFAGYLTYLSRRVGLSIAQAPFIFCCLICIFLYSFAIVDELVLGAYFAFILGLALLVISTYNKSLQTHLLKSFNCSCVIYIVPYGLLFIAISQGFKFLGWDEFSFWALSQKIIFDTGALYKENSPISYKFYPPAQQLFQYYLTKMTFWSEKNVLFAQIFWVLSGLMCVAGTLINKSLYAAITFLFSCAFLYYFNFSFSKFF